MTFFLESTTTIYEYLEAAVKRFEDVDGEDMWEELIAALPRLADLNESDWRIQEAPASLPYEDWTVGQSAKKIIDGAVAVQEGLRMANGYQRFDIWEHVADAVLVFAFS